MSLTKQALTASVINIDLVARCRDMVDAADRSALPAPLLEDHCAAYFRNRVNDFECRCTTSSFWLVWYLFWTIDRSDNDFFNSLGRSRYIRAAYFYLRFIRHHLVL
jgi:hypothetical protein